MINKAKCKHSIVAWQQKMIRAHDSYPLGQYMSSNAALFCTNRIIHITNSIQRCIRNGSN